MSRFLALMVLAWVLPATLSAATAESYWGDYQRAMREPVPLPRARHDGDFQFRWTRLSGSNDPLSIRVWRDRGRLYVRSVRSKYRLDFEPGRIVRDQRRVLSKQQAEEFLGLLRSDDFWRPFDEKELEFKRGFLGGARWLLEIQDRSGSRSLSMFSPALLVGQPLPSGMRDFQPYIAVASFLLRTTNIFPDEYEARY